MKIYSEAEVEIILREVGKMDHQEDLQGQMIIYTGLFNWKDGTVRDQPDPFWDKE